MWPERLHTQLGRYGVVLLTTSARTTSPCLSFAFALQLTSINIDITFSPGIQQPRNAWDRRRVSFDRSAHLHPYQTSCISSVCYSLLLSIRLLTDHDGSRDIQGK